VPLEQQGLSGFNSDDAHSRFSSDTNCSDPDYWHVEAHVLIRFADFDHDCAFTRKRSTALDSLICSFQSFDGNDRAVFDDDCLPDIESRDFLCDIPAKLNVVLLAG